MDDIFENFRTNDDGSYTIMPVSGSIYNGNDSRYFVTSGRSNPGVSSPLPGVRIGSNSEQYGTGASSTGQYNFGDGISGTYGRSAVYGRQLYSNYNTIVGYKGRPVYNPFSENVVNLYDPTYQNSQYEHLNHNVDHYGFTANVPYVYGGFNPTATSETSWFTAPDAPDRPDLPDAPDPTFEKRQMKSDLPDVVERQLFSGQREIVGGDLPSQQSELSGSTFGVSEGVNRDGIAFRSLDELNASEQRNLGSPKAYRVPQNYATANGQGSYFGGGTFTPDQIGNETDTAIFFIGYGWVSKNRLTPLY